MLSILSWRLSTELFRDPSIACRLPNSFSRFQLERNVTKGRYSNCIFMFFSKLILNSFFRLHVPNFSNLPPPPPPPSLWSSDPLPLLTPDQALLGDSRLLDGGGRLLLSRLLTAATPLPSLLFVDEPVLALLLLFPLLVPFVAGAGLGPGLSSTSWHCSSCLGMNGEPV